MKNILLIFLKTYKRNISPIFEFLFGRACRYTPTCSEYSHQAISKYGLLKGGKMSLKRIVRCNPFVKGGFDPVEYSA